MLLEEVVIRTYGGQLRPPAGADGICLHIVDQGAAQRQQEGRVGRDDELAAIEKVLRAHPLADGFDFIRSERTLLEILPKGVTKGLALIKLTEYLNVDIANTVAIGDFDNDVAMLKTARLGIAVANASKSAMEAADAVTVSNEDDAIAEVIYGLENGKYSIG